MNSRKIIVYFDMDGVLAKWKTAEMHVMQTPGYFLNLELEIGVRDAILELTKNGVECRILSAVWNDAFAQEKAMWLKNYGLGDIHAIFVPCKVNKGDYITSNNDDINVLIDDYSWNLFNWEETKKHGEFIAIKFMNSINGTTGKWKGRRIYNGSGVEIANEIETHLNSFVSELV